MIAGLVPFRGANFARELLLRKLEAEVDADRLPAHVVEVMGTLHSAPAALAHALINRAAKDSNALR